MARAFEGKETPAEERLEDKAMAKHHNEEGVRVAKEAG